MSTKTKCILGFQVSVLGKVYVFAQASLLYFLYTSFVRTQSFATPLVFQAFSGFILKHSYQTVSAKGLKFETDFITLFPSKSTLALKIKKRESGFTELHASTMGEAEKRPL